MDKFGGLVDFLSSSSIQRQFSLHKRSEPSFRSPRSTMENGRHMISGNEESELSISIGSRVGIAPQLHRNDEMDFFSQEKKMMSAPSDLDLTVRSVSMKNEDLKINTRLHLSSSDQSIVDDEMSRTEDDKEANNELASMQAELARINEENQKLRGMLNQVTTNYNALQMDIITLMQQKQKTEVVNDKIEPKNNDVIVPRQFMDLGPTSNGSNDSSSRSSTASRDRSSSPSNNVEVGSMNYQINKNIIPFNCDKSSRDDNSPDERWNPNKAPKLTPPKSITDQQAQEATMRKARVSVRARSEAPMITDGCQWRKYGQKMAKGNPCPRAYYRCTMATGCPVRKQVQRCAEDRSVLITTYEGTHNHPLPPAAMAMASTTSSAASMLLSGSMSSSDSLMNPNFLARTILPCTSSLATISASAPFPTVTLDLTHSSNPLQLNGRPTSSQFQVPMPVVPTSFDQSKFSGLQMSSGPMSVDVAQLTTQPSTLADTVSAAIANDPGFTAAIAAAISSIMGGSRQVGNCVISGNDNNASFSNPSGSNN